MNEGFRTFIAASERDRIDTFLSAAQRLGANAQYIEKDFWVTWTLDVLYRGLLALGFIGSKVILIFQPQFRWRNAAFDMSVNQTVLETYFRDTAWRRELR